MREYDFTYIIQPDAEEARVEEIHQRVASIVTGGQGQILLRDDWGKRKLAYEIRKFQKGNYFVLSLLGDGKFIPALERILRIDADVLRFLAVCVDYDVKDIDARVEEARREEAERAERRAERERLEAERAERERLHAERVESERAAAAAAEAESQSDEEGEPGGETASPGAGEAAAPVADDPGESSPQGESSPPAAAEAGGERSEG